MVAKGSSEDEVVWTAIDLTYRDGANVNFLIDPENSADPEIENVEFVIKYRAEGENEKSVTLQTATKPSFEVPIEASSLKVRCEARVSVSNVSELG